MRTDDVKAVLHRYLDMARQTMIWKLEGASDYDIRRPMTPTGTNLLGLVKHLALIEYGYFGDVFGRPPAEALPDVESPNADLFATADERRDDVVARYRRAIDHADATIDALPLDATGTVPWWPDDVNPVTLHWVMVHVIAETNRHAGHADILRELIDGSVGHREGASNLPGLDADGWRRHVEMVENAASGAAWPPPTPSAS